MRDRLLDLSPVWYSNYASESDRDDASGLYSGEKELSYSAPQMQMMVVSVEGARSKRSAYGGEIRREPFGADRRYTHVLSSSVGTGIRENARIWLGLARHIRAYSTTLTYAVGAYCIYDNDIYICKQAVTAPEPFTDAHWEPVMHGYIVTFIADATRQNGGFVVGVEEMPWRRSL